MSKDQDRSKSVQCFEMYKMENAINVAYPYSSAQVHVPGRKSSALFVPAPCEAMAALDLVEENHFVTEGYFCLRDAVPKGLIEKTRQYIDDNYADWHAISKRSDDWRCHFELCFDSLSAPIEHGALLNLLTCSPKIMSKVRSLIGEPWGIFYTQIALRTPILKLKSPEHTDSLNSGRNDYHIDGQANDAGIM